MRRSPLRSKVDGASSRRGNQLVRRCGVLREPRAVCGAGEGEVRGEGRPLGPASPPRTPGDSRARGQAARVSAGQRWVRSGERKGQDRGKGEEGESLGTTPGLLAWAVGGLMRAPWRGLVWAWCGTSLLEEGSPTWQPVPPPVAGPPFCLGPSTSQEAQAESSLAPGPGRAQAGLTAIRSLWLLQ